MGLPEEEIIERVLKLADGAQAEVQVSSGEKALTRFSDNAISQNVAHRSTDVIIRLMDDAGRMGKASINRAGDADLAAAVERARAVMRVQKPDPELLALSDPRPVPKNDGLFDAVTAAYTPAQRGDRLLELVQACEPDGQEASGSLETGWSGLALGNSNGVRVSHRETSATFEVTVKDSDGMGWAGGFDAIKAYQWFSLALRGKAQISAIDASLDPKAGLDHVASKMNENQIARAKQAVKDWLSKR